MMMTMKLSLLAAIMSIGLVSGQDPTASIRVDSFQVTNTAGNPFFDEWSVEINGPDTLSIKTPIKKDLPDNIMIRGAYTFAGEALPEMEISLCEGFEDIIYGQDIVSSGIPKGVFPARCPVKAGQNLEIRKYTFPNSKIPPGIPEGTLVSDISVYEPGKDPYIILHFEGALIHKLPGFGR